MSKWKDAALHEVSREEFHRRLKVCHAGKMENQTKAANKPAQTVPPPSAPALQQQANMCEFVVESYSIM